MTIAAVVNGGQVPEAKPIVEVAEARTELKAAGTFGGELKLWDGGKLTMGSTTITIATDTEAEAKAVAKPKAVILSSASVEAAVREYFADIPELVQVAKCESRFRQYGSNGEVLRGEVNYLDRGVMQINEGYHLEKAISLGIDILTLEGNMAYARYLYTQQGLQPWISSSPCWHGSIEAEIALSN